MENEQKRLEETLTIAREQLKRAKTRNEEAKNAIIQAKKEMREDTSHSFGSLWSSEDFEALAELSQYANAVADKITDYEEVEHQIMQLEQQLKSPYFARMDFRFDGEEAFDHIYLGRTSLKKEHSYEMVVYDWRSPIASVFYRFVGGEAYYDAPGGRITGELGLKRQYEINNGVLEFYFDADVEIVDEFLRKMLSQNASAQMKAIVETIQKDQDVVIRDMENDLMMVQGVAGSGKTSIALHRAAYLMYKGLSEKLGADNIIIISPNELFEQYISNVLPELGEDKIVSVVFEEVLGKILKKQGIQTRNQFLENLLTNESSQNLVKISMEFKMSSTFIKMLNKFLIDIPVRFVEFEDVYYEGKRIAKKEVLKKKAEGRPEVPLCIRLMQLEDFVLELVKAYKKGRLKKAEAAELKRQIQKFTSLDILNLYKEMLSDKEYFYSLAEGLMIPEEIEEIRKLSLERMKYRKIPYDDAAVLAYLTVKLNGASAYKNIKQVVIDEAQDYYALHYEIFRLLFPGAKYTILGDINQTLEKKEDLTVYEQIKLILNKKKASLVILNKSFRCTNQILTFSSKFIDSQIKIESFNREGEEPGIYKVETKEELSQAIKREVDICMDSGYQSIGLICKTKKNAEFLYTCLKDQMQVNLVWEGYEQDLQGVFIIPVYMSKGLEFDAVLICDADVENYHSEEDRKLLYIGCTRALHRLALVGMSPYF